MTEEGKYIYSIIREDGNRNFGFLAGINNRQVHLIGFQDLAAVVSNTPIIDFDRMPKEELTRYLLIHEHLNEQLMRDHDLIPMSFGIIAGSEEELRKILESAFLQFKTALKRVSGKAEFVVQVFWDEKKALNELLESDPEIRKLKKEADSRGTILGMPLKIKIGKLIFEALQVKKREYADEIEKSILKEFPDIVSGKHLVKDMVMNHSILIDRSRVPELDEKMNELGERYGATLKFKYIGPMPPYSFANINLSLGNFELVESARNILELGVEASPDQLKKAYYGQAHKYHPDFYEHKQDGALQEEMSNKMQEVSRAYELLTTYCDHYARLLPPELSGRCSFRKPDVENLLIIKSDTNTRMTRE